MDFGQWQALTDAERNTAWAAMSDAERSDLVRSELRATRDELLRRFDALQDAAIEGRAYGPVRLDPIRSIDPATGEPHDVTGHLVAENVLANRWVLVTELAELLALVAVAAVAGNRATFEHLETVALGAIARGAEENRRAAVLERMRPRIEALIERAEQGDRVSSYLHPLAADAVHRWVQEAKDAACRGDARECEDLIARAHKKIDLERSWYPPAGEVH